MNKRSKKFHLLTGVSLIFLLSAHVVRAYEYTDVNDYLYPNKNQKKISMDFKGAKLNDVLKIFSQQSGMNFIAATSIADKSIDLYLENVPIEAALERILFANDLTYELQPENNIFIVKSINKPQVELITRVYQLQNASVPSSKLLSMIQFEGGSSSKKDESGSGDSKEGGIIGAVQAILTPNGKVIEDPRTNSLIVTDVPTQFPMIEQTIARLDIRVPQILIEIEMLDIAKGNSEKIGVKWGDTPLTFRGGEHDEVAPFDTSTLLHKNYTFEEAEYRVSTVSFAGLAYTLQFLRTQTDTKNLARPRILTLNNETAQIAIKTDEVIGLQTQVTSGASIDQSSVEAERTETGVFLRVTPQANIETREIKMAIEPKVIQAKKSTAGLGDFKDPEERGTQSILRVMDGDTIIIGGLMQNNVDLSKTNVPFLSKIPLLGSTFRHKDGTNTDRELIIFITPHILRDNPISTTGHTPTKPLVREQDISSSRQKMINENLSLYEKKR